MNRRRILYIIGGVVLALLIVGGVVVLSVLPTMIANSFNYPNRQPLVKNPGDYGLAYEDVSIETEDGVTLAGWLMMGSGDDVIIIGHPATFTRYGYSLEHEGAVGSGFDRDVEFFDASRTDLAVGVDAVAKLEVLDRGLEPAVELLGIGGIRCREISGDPEPLPEFRDSRTLRTELENRTA